MVRTPVSAFVQSAFEKKSPCTLNDPQSVQRNGKAARSPTALRRPCATATRSGDRSDALEGHHALFRLKSRHVRISTGVSRIATPITVSTEVAAADPKRWFAPVRSL